MLRVSPHQRGRLIEIIHNLTDRIAEARMNSWLGEVQGLQVSLTKAKEKLTSLDRTMADARSRGNLADLGMPVARGPQ